MHGFLNDVRVAVRALGRAPVFAAAAVLTLAVGIAATTTLFSVVNGVLLRPLSFPESDRIVRLFQVDDAGNRSNYSGPNFEDLREQSRSFAALAQLGGFGTVSVVGGSEAARASRVAVGRDFFAVVGVQPAVGRAFAPDEVVDGGSPAVVVSHDFWTGFLGGRTDLRGTTLTFSGRVHEVVGVMPAGVQAPAAVDLIVPAAIGGPTGTRTAHNWQVLGRLAPGVSHQAAQRELSLLAGRLKAVHGDDTWMSDAALVPLREDVVGRVRPALMVLLGAAVFLMVIAAANVANLLLTRAAGRRRELAVRTALGASRGRLVRLFVAESLVLALLAGGLGMLLAVWGVELLRTVAPANLPRATEVRVDAAVLLFAVAASLLTALGLGVGTGLRGAGTRDLRGALAERREGGASTGRLRGALAAGQVALTLVLLVGAGLLGRSFLRVLATDSGYHTSGAVVLSVARDWPETEGEAARLVGFYDLLMERLRAIPGVERVGGVSGLPLWSGFGSGTFLLLERPDEVSSFDDFGELARIPERTGHAEYRVASPGYFEAMGIPLRHGRGFDDRDHVDAPHVALVSESFARRTWPGQDPIGRYVQFGNMDGDLRAFTVVGVVGDVREGGPEAEPQPTLYGNSRQRIGGAASMEIVLHGTADPAAVIPAARRVVRELAPDVPPRLRTLEEIFARGIAQRRFNLLLLGVFAAAALLVSLIGLYGVVSHTVAQRTHELGVRIALGASTERVIGLVVRQAALLAAAGIGLGLAAALALSRLIAGLLFGVTALDPVTYALVALLLTAVALLASYLPARRATRVDPMRALRAD
jgi:putative ABC transport system permease protein